MSSAGNPDARDDRDDGREESATERADRNWSEVLQELRVLQTGTQILTGFLLALAFQPAFAELSAGQRTLYLALVVLSAVSAIIALAPVALHRALFRRQVKPFLVTLGHVALVGALGAIALLLVGVVAFIVDIVVDGAAAWIAVAGLGAVIAILWFVIPLFVRRRHPFQEHP